MPPDDPATPAAPPAPPAPPAAPEPDTFSRAYVQDLRAENAQRRKELRAEQEAHAATRQQAALDHSITDGIYRHGVDPKLARAVLASEPARLTDVDVQDTASLPSRMDEVLIAT